MFDAVIFLTKRKKWIYLVFGLMNIIGGSGGPLHQFLKISKIWNPEYKLFHNLNHLEISTASLRKTGVSLDFLLDRRY